MGLFGQKEQNVSRSNVDVDLTESAGWYMSDSIKSEWPQSRLDEVADLNGWNQGVALYERDDYDSMMHCADLLSPALAHELYGPGILAAEAVLDTVHKVLFAALTAPPDAKTFAESAQRCARLALLTIRNHGCQPASMGGNGMFDHIFQDRGNEMLLGSAIAPKDRPWEGDLNRFFAIPANVSLSGGAPNVWEWQP